MFIISKEVPAMMKKSSAMSASYSYCMPNAAAGTSARVCVNLDTASLAVSIIICLISLLVLKV